MKSFLVKALLNFFKKFKCTLKTIHDNQKHDRNGFATLQNIYLKLQFKSAF